MTTTHPWGLADIGPSLIRPPTHTRPPRGANPVHPLSQLRILRYALTVQARHFPLPTGETIPARLADDMEWVQSAIDAAEGRA